MMIRWMYGRVSKASQTDSLNDQVVGRSRQFNLTLEGRLSMELLGLCNGRQQKEFL